MRRSLRITEVMEQRTQILYGLLASVKCKDSESKEVTKVLAKAITLIAKSPSSK